MLSSFQKISRYCTNTIYLFTIHCLFRGVKLTPKMEYIKRYRLQFSEQFLLLKWSCFYYFEAVFHCCVFLYVRENTHVIIFLLRRISVNVLRHVLRMVMPEEAGSLIIIIIIITVFIHTQEHPSMRIKRIKMDTSILTMEFVYFFIFEIS
jgi:hypothetical protein